MKRSYILMFFLTLIISSCASTYVPQTAEVNLISEQKDKVIKVRSTGYGLTKDDALKDAEKKAFRILFFRGIPSSCVETPLLGTDEKFFKAKNPKYFNTFYNGSYHSFIMDSYSFSKPIKKNKLYTETREITINLISLKRDLQKNELIRKFGL